jgi:1-acyl-sn-glycerol-3-phosphate acyltransferase
MADTEEKVITAATRKAAVKKAATKKAAVKKATVKKSAVKKAATRKAATRKAATRKAAVKKKALKKKAVKKKALKKAVVKKSVSGKTAVRTDNVKKPAPSKRATAGVYAQFIAALSAIPTGAIETLAQGRDLSRKALAELQTSFDTLRGVTTVMQNLAGPGDSSREGLNGPDPEVMDAQAPLWNALMDYYFRLEIDGWERLPDRASLLIGIHSGGPLTMDAWTVAMAWWRHFHGSRTLHGTAHDVLMKSPGIGSYFRRLGVISPARESMSAAFNAGHDVILWPGAVDDSYRRFDKRDKAILAGRKGFIRLAIRERVPITPMATIGGHDTLIVLSEGRGLAKVLGLKERMRSDLAPITLSVPFGITLHLTPFQHIPLPAKIRTRFLEPIYLDPDPDKENDQQYVDRMYKEVESAIQAGMDELAKKRKFPIWG